MIQEYYPTWKGYLFRLQQEAPKPRPVICQGKNVSNRPHFYGPEHHGSISREEGEQLCSEEGNFLIRESQTEPGRFTLVLRVLDMVKNFKLYYENGKHFVGEKRFDSVYALAEDGLITMYVENKAQDYIESMVHQPVYNSLSRYSSIGSRHGTTKGRYSCKRAIYPNAPSPVDVEHPGVYSSSALHHHQHNSDFPRTSPALFDASSIDDEEADEFYYEPGSVHPNVLDSGYERSDPESINSRDGACYLGYQEESRSLILTEDSSDQSLISRVDVCGKKHLTPTSSDERKRTKKRIATEDHFQRKQREYYENQELHLLQEEELYNELAAAPINVAFTDNRIPRRISYDHCRIQKSEERANKDEASRRFSSGLPICASGGLSPYRKPSVVQKQTTTVAHVRQLSNGADGRMQSPGYLEKQQETCNENEGFINNEGQHNPYRISHGNPSMPVTNERTSLDQLMAVHRQLEEESRHQDVIDDEYDDDRYDFHVRQRSDPVELIYRQESSLAGKDLPFYRSSQTVNERFPQRTKVASKSQLSVHRTGSVGSCESGLSNSSSGVDRADTSSSNRTHDSSHFSSEDDRITPSPRHRLLLQRQMSDLPLHQHSSVYTPDARSSRVTPPVEESPWIYRRDANRKPTSRSRSSSANRRRAPLTQINSNNSSDVEEKASRKKSDAVYQSEENRERRNSLDLSTLSCEQPTSPVLSPRHKSESGGVLEPAHGGFQNSPKPKPKLRTSHSNSQAEVEQRKPKPLQRRATTCEITSGKNKNLLPTSPSSGNVKGKQKESDEVKSKSSSPSKSKKSVTSPLFRNPSASQSHRHRHVTSSSSKSSRCKGGIAQQYEKEHQYKSHTYRGLQWCEYCGNFMWGVIQQGVQCLDCGLNVHKQCSKLVPNDCQPALKHVKHAYGVDLTTLVKLHGTQRPLVVDICIAEIEKRGMNAEGIYREAGKHDDVTEVKATFDQYGLDTDLSSYDDIHTIASALKLYFRELPVPLIPYQLYSRFINAAKISHSDGKLDAIRMGLSAMPGAHLQTVKYLIQHLGRITEQSFLNQMSAHNLGIVFGPTILRAPEKEALDQHMNDTRFQKEVIATIIEYRHFLFGAG